MIGKKRVFLLITTAIIIYAVFFLFSLNKTLEKPEGLLINDVSHLNPTFVKKIIANQEIQGLQETLAEARANNLKVSIAGKRHSMGGHAFYKNAVVLDMTSFNKILSLNTKNKIIRVQSGANWKQVIEHINPHNLSVGVMQAYNTFTIGGSLSVNVHESDPNYGPLIETVDSFRLLLANGTIVNVSRTENSDLFGLVIGGYGLFGVILDVDLRLTDNKVYLKNEYIIDYNNYVATFRKVRKNPEIKSVYARMSIARDDSLLKEVVLTTYETTNQSGGSYFELRPTKKVALKKFLFGLSRKYDWGKKLRWFIQKEHGNLEFPESITRNNYMNNDLSFLEYHSSRKTDILQEYFIPPESFPAFVDGLKNVITTNNLNLLSATIRYVPENKESLLSYSTKEYFGLVLYFNVGTSKEEQKEVEKWTQELIGLSLANEGTYYLPYQLYASKGQINAAYPNLNLFFQKKKQYDPHELFMNKFYAKYALGEEDE